MNQPKSLQAGTRIDDYEITGTLWTTNSGFIYQARDLDRDRDVLIQEYLPAILATRHWSGIHAMALEGLEDDFDQGLTRFLREARILAQINDPYVCRVYEYTEANATAYMVLDYEPGQTLQERLAGHKRPLEEAEIRQLLVPLLKGLRVAHAADLLHRDIHPANVYLRDVGPPVLIGFGSPTIVPRDDGEHHIEQRVAPGYSPVEQYQSDGDVGPWSDLYALGATMYRCLSGATPVDATRRITHIAQDKEDPLVPALELGGGDHSAALLSAIDWMLEPMASDRPGSAGAVLGSLSEESTAVAPERAQDKETVSKKGGREKSRREETSRADPQAPQQLDMPYRDHGEPRAPAARSPETTPPPLSVDLERSRRGRRASRLDTVWGWPLLMIAAGLVLIGVFVFYEPDSPESLAVGETAPGSGVPAPAPDDGYPPPDIPERVKFDHDTDEERAAEYRDLQQRIARIERALESAEAHVAAGRLVSPPDGNALAEYRAVLELDPDNVDARLGLSAIQNRLVESARGAFDEKDIEGARQLLAQAADVRDDSEEVAALEEEIQAYVAEQERAAQQAREQERLREQARLRAERERRERIASLVEQAKAASADGRLTQPPGNNALGYYRQILRLDAGHDDAQAGVERIGRAYLDQAAEALARDELDKADGLLNTVAAILPDNESVPLLRKQLDTRREVAERERREREQVAEREALERREREAAEREARERRERELAAERAARAAQAEQAAQAQVEPDTPAAGSEAQDEAMEEGITAYYGGNYEFAFRRLNPLAEQSNARAKFRVAMMYYHGRGTEQDANLARTLINEALPEIRSRAEQGIPWAQADLGSLYADGIVLTEDDDEAVRLYRLAAEQGYAGAQTNLGVMYANGEGVTRSRDNAVLWLRRAAAQGDRIALNNLRALGVQ